MDMSNFIPVLMCPSCWRIQPIRDEWGAGLDRWIDPAPFFTHEAYGSGSFQFIDGYCDPCLDEMRAHNEQILIQASMERLNS